MSIEFNTNDFISGLNRISREKQKKVLEEMDKALLLAAIRIEADAVQLAPEHDRDLVQNIGYKEAHLSETKLRYIVYSNVKYSAAVEYGTRPHKVSPEHLKKWARDKMGDEKLAFALAAHIARNGTKAHPFFRPAFHKNEQFLKDSLKAALKKGLKG